MSAGVQRTFASLSVRNYRRYFTGQVVSITGNWMQTVAEMWLVLQLTGSGVSVGLTAGLQFLPILLFGAWGGLLADRMPKRRLLMITQSLMAIPALTLWALTTSGSVEIWMVYALVFARGTVNAIDNPARQSFAIEMVGADRVVNAVALNSVIVHTARILGPAAAGGVIALFGVGPCFLVNAISFAAMLLALRGMDPERLHTPEVAVRARGQLRGALRYVAATPSLLIPLAMMAVVGTLSFNFQILLPLLASFTWHGTAATYTALAVAMGVGSVAGALAAGARGRVGPRLLVAAAAAFGVAELLVALAPTRRAPAARPHPARRRQRDLRGRDQLVAPARGRAVDARPRDGALLGRLPRLDADRRPAGRAGSPRSPARAPASWWARAAALAAAAGAKLAFERVRPAPARKRPCESSSRTRTARRLRSLGTRP